MAPPVDAQRRQSVVEEMSNDCPVKTVAPSPADWGTGGAWGSACLRGAVITNATIVHQLPKKYQNLKILQLCN